MTKCKNCNCNCHCDSAMHLPEDSLDKMVERYKNTKDIDGNPSPVSDTLTEILRRLIDDPGGRKLFMQEGDQFVGTWTETVRSLIRTEMTMFKKKIDLYD